MTYNSVHDLPSFVELSNQLNALKLVSIFLPPDERTKLKQLEAQIKELGDTVDNFYTLLGDRHWIFHDSLNVEKVRGILAHNTSAEDAERQFIALYTDPEFLDFAIMRCNRFEALRKRMRLIEKARDDYFAERYYACIFLLLSVADGFVNELDSEHRGLHTRSEEELGAWDSPISHHKGIANVHRTFLKTISVTRTEPVYELYRNGIMHGTVLDFDNIVVASKAWNMLFAVVDWATAKKKAEMPKPPQKSFRETIHQMIETEKDKKLLGEWSSYVLHAGEPGFEDDPAFVACTAYLAAWKAKNYGKMSKFLSNMVVAYHRENAMPKRVSDDYKPHALEEFEVLSLNHETASVCNIEVKTKIASRKEHIATLRWLYEDKNGKVTLLSKGDGEWKLLTWGVAFFLN
ncbi:hypothetical protein EI42_03133 [Thermosporothrix hazakensis]|jgi:hypothetical protein|uniref:Uncharacterized protein n=1 Tax=Thermosporothrix hazakensis TaxID=644383 RepID=A0A326UIV9_THEHA|nr:hypothetical protein [Thermosporothrix hazakensis]PZW28379.1 hypothetical protein EI42_03133 [Thermosporothrix hazakensis]GCE46261.1 hypothetical protein KTH_11300 [Thermosporothrix hazakensis]